MSEISFTDRIAEMVNKRRKGIFMADLPVNKKTATELNTYDVLKKRLENKL